jgi:glycerophosphoryl diester phosphodiesterase
VGAETAHWQTKPSNPEGKLPKLTKPLVLDGKLDEWEGATSVLLRYASYIAHIKPGHEWRGPKDAGAEMYCAWNDDGLCLAAIVADDNVHNERPPGFIWQQDCLELFIDGRVGQAFMKPPYSKGAYQLFVRPPVGKLPAALHVGERDEPIEGLRIAGKRTPTGYTVEMFIPWKAFPGFRPQAGSPFGLQYSLCDYDERDENIDQPMVMSWRAATMLFRSPQKLVRYELTKTVPVGANVSLGSLVNVDIPSAIALGDSATFSIEMGRPLASMADTVEILVSDWAGKLVLQKRKHLQKMGKPWHGSKQAVCEWRFADVENGAYRIEVWPKDARGALLGSATRDVVIARKPFLRWRSGGKPTILAHRGAPPAELPENSIAAFRKALADGADFIEIDVRQSKDGVLVLLHDSGLGRTTTGGHDDRVSGHTLAELKALFLKSQAGKVTTHRIPTLKETIEWARGKTVLFLDFKILEIEKVVRFVQEEKAQTFCVPMTYRFEDTLRVHRLAPEMVIYANADGTRNNVENLLKGDVSKDRLFVYIKRYDRSVIDRMHANGIMVQYGGVQGRGGTSLEPYLGWLEKGIDSFNTDDVPRAAAAIRRFYKR